MQILAIIIKDLSQSLRTAFAIAMTFIMPMLVTGLFYFAFGGLNKGAPDIQATRVQVVNLDQAGSEVSAGQNLVRFLQDPSFSSLVQLKVVPDEKTARASIIDKTADVALIIPNDFSSSILTSAAPTSIVLYKDPAITLGPSIVRELVAQYVDGYSGVRVAVSTVTEEARLHNLPLDEATLRKVMLDYYTNLPSLNQNPPVNLTLSAPAAKSNNGEQDTSIVGRIMTGMLVFFVFFTGVFSFETIVTESENGTLSRLFSTPVHRGIIFAGKYLAALLLLIIQVTVLVVASTVAFGIKWGSLPSILLSATGMIIAATGFGIMLMSLIKNSKQSGPVVGGILAVTGMMGGLFFQAGNDDSFDVFRFLNLLTPQGWAHKAWKASLAGEQFSSIFPITLVLLAIGLVCFVIGTLQFRKRFA